MAETQVAGEEMVLGGQVVQVAMHLAVLAVAALAALPEEREVPTGPLKRQFLGKQTCLPH